MCQRLYPSVTLRACSSSHVYTYTVHNNGLKLTAGVRWYGAHACVVQGRERVILLLGWLAFRTWLLHYEISLSAGWAGARAFSKRICCSERASERASPNVLCRIEWDWIAGSFFFLGAFFAGSFVNGVKGLVNFRKAVFGWIFGRKKGAFHVAPGHDERNVIIVEGIGGNDQNEIPFMCWLPELIGSLLSWLLPHLY